MQRICDPQKNVAMYFDKIRLNNKSLFLEPTTAIEVKKLITNLPNKKSSGHDEISNILLKEMKTNISAPLANIFNSSLTKGEFPDIMKIGEIAPLHKGKNRDEVENYRPISLLMTISQLLEKVLYRRVYRFLTTTSQLYQSQYGFRKNHTCDHAVGELISEIVKQLQKGNYTACLLLDLSKAFDTLQHSILFAKLKQYGIRGTCLEWFKSYLTNREMRVKCKIAGEDSLTISVKHTVEYGMPQGSCLRPFLFLVFCNDLNLQLTFLQCIQFVDNTTLYMSNRNLNYIKHCTNLDALTLKDWFYANKLTLNIDKWMCLLFKPNGKEGNLTLSVATKQIKNVKKAKFLEIWLDDELKWTEHLRQLITKLKSKIGLLYKCKNLLMAHAKRILYFVQIQSHLTYGCIIWDSMLKNSQIKELQSIQMKCVQQIDPKLSQREVFNKHRILKIDNLIKLENQKLWHKLHMNMVSSKLKKNMLHDKRNLSLQRSHSYNTCNKNLPMISLAKHQKYHNNFLVKGLVDYNILDKDICEIKNFSYFVHKCKLRLLYQQ